MIQLAAQTLQSFFSGGGKAREHAEYPLAEVDLRAPGPAPALRARLFDGDDFAFANPAAIHGPEDEIPSPAASVLATSSGRRRSSAARAGSAASRS